MMISLLWAILFVVPAHAASRVVVSTPEPMQVFMDGMILPTSVGSIRTSIPQVNPGQHVFAFHSLTGAPLHSETLLIPDNADVRVTYIPGAPLSVTGGGSSVSQGGAGSFDATQTSNASGMAVADPIGPRQSMGSSPSHPSSGSIVEGSAASTAGAAGLQRAMTTPTPANLVTGAGRGLKSMTVGAHAGTNFGREAPAQQTIKKANVTYGRAVFKKASGGPLVIYENGHMLAQLPAGQAEAVVELEVGRRELEIRSGHDYRVLFQGDLQVDEGHVESVNISDSAPPKATIRPWLWKDL